MVKIAQTGSSKLKCFEGNFAFDTKNAGGDRKLQCKNSESALIFLSPPAFLVSKPKLPSKHLIFGRPVWAILTTYRSEIFRTCRKEVENRLAKVSEFSLQFPLSIWCQLQNDKNFHFSNGRHFRVDEAWESNWCSKDSSSDKLSNGENRMSLSGL